MRWSIEELVMGWHVVSHRGYKWYIRLWRFPRTFFRQLRYTVKWIFTGYYPTTWWMSDSAILMSIRSNLKNFIKNKKRRGWGFSPVVLDQLNLDNLDDETSKIAMLAYESIADRIITLIGYVLEETDKDRYGVVGIQQDQFNKDYDELFGLLGKYLYIFSD